MAALTDNRDTIERDGVFVSATVATGETIYAGALVSIDSSGEAVAASDTASTSCVGRAETSAAAGETVTIKRGVFQYENGDTFVKADIGLLTYVSDDQTVARVATTTNDIVAGRLIDVDSDGVWIDTADQG